jgi:hypothetical protein
MMRRMLRGIPMGVTEPTVIASPPTVTWGTTVQLTSPVTIAHNDARISLQNGYPIDDASHSQRGNAIDSNGLGGAVFAFEHYGSEFDFGIYSIDTVGGTYWIEVDGQVTTAAPFNPTGVSVSAGNTYNCFVQFGSTALRRIRVYYWNAGLRFVWVHAADSIAAYPSPLARAVMYGDSWVGSHNSNTEQQGIPARIGRMLGCSMGVCGQGGTGYNYAGTVRAYDDPVRVGRAAAWLPDYAIIFGTINTNGQGSAVQPYAASLYSQWATLSPKTRLWVCGVPPQGDTVTTENQDYNTAVKAAALAAPNVVAFIDMIAGTWTLHDGVTTGGAGVQWIKTAQSLISASHPTADGDQYLARMIGNAIIESSTAMVAANL